MKKMMLVIYFFVMLLLGLVFEKEAESVAVPSNFNPSNDLTRRYSRKQVLNGGTTTIKKKNGEVYLTFPFDKTPYIFFTSFVLNGPTDNYHGFIETIYYRDKVKIKDMYYERNPVKTDKVGIYSTDICFTSEDGIIYHYKNVPYLVSSDKPTVYFSEITFDKENKSLSGNIKMPVSKNTYQVELFYTDNDEYHYQEGVAESSGDFNLSLSREAQEGKMYLRVSDGLGNYADACDILNQGSTSFQISEEALKAIQSSPIKSRNKQHFWQIIKRIVIRIFGIIVVILTLLRLRVIIKRRKRRRRL